MAKMIVAVFNDRESAETASDELKANGISPDDASIVELVRENDSLPSHDNISDKTVGGAALGGVAGMILGVGTVAVPGLGVIAAAGPIAGLLAGVVTGGVIGSLVDLGIPEDASEDYENEVREGGVLWSMEINEDNGGKIARILNDNNARRVEIHNK